MNGFIVGMLLIPPFVFQQLLTVRIAETLLLIVYAYLAGRKFRVGPNLLILIGVLFMNLLTPVGEVLIRIAGFPLTRTALEQGLMRGLLFIGLVYISRGSISGSMELPGRAGALVGRTLYYFETILNFDAPTGERGIVYAMTHLSRRMDEILLSCTAGCPGTDEGGGDTRSAAESARPAAPAFAVFLVVSFWTAAAASFFLA